MYHPMQQASEEQTTDDGMDLTAVLVFALSILGWGGLGVYSVLSVFGLVG